MGKRFLLLSTIIIVIIIIICWFVGSTEYSVFKRSLKPEHYRKEIQTDKHYVCWTGGYDSSFRVSQLIHAGKRVQPIYLGMDDVDDEGKKLIRIKRKNKKNEIQSMRKIRRILESIYPDAKYLLLPTIYINKIVNPNPEIKKCSSYLYSKLGWFTRNVNQYERILQIAYQSFEPLEICLEADGHLSKSIEKFINGVERNCRLTNKLPNKYKCACIFGVVRFPVIHLTKKEMLKIATKEGYRQVLDHSWSCWTPVVVNGISLPCGQCDMCRHRII